LTTKPVVPLNEVLGLIVITLAVSVIPGERYVVTALAGIVVESGKTIPELPPAVIVIVYLRL
jgi:hypothetical protein